MRPGMRVQRLLLLPLLLVLGLGPRASEPSAVYSGAATTKAWRAWSQRLSEIKVAASTPPPLPPLATAASHPLHSYPH
jgi:hypothetical protein